MEDLPTGVGGRCEIFYTKFSDDLIVLAPNADQVDGIMSTAATLNLVSVRQSRGLTLEEITRATRIAPRYLNAIEAEDFAKLPGGVYAVSYLRQYARAIGFSEVELLDRYYALKQPEPAPVLALKQSSRPKTRLGESLAHLFGHLSPKPRTQHPA